MYRREVQLPLPNNYSLINAVAVESIILYVCTLTSLLNVKYTKMAMVAE